MVYEKENGCHKIQGGGIMKPWFIISGNTEKSEELRNERA